MSYEFDAKKVAAEVIEWVREQFAQTASPDTKAVIGISGGKDSSVAAAVCVKALGKDRVIGVLMPQGEQSDIAYSRLLVDTLGIKSYTINIGDTVSAFMNELKKHIEPSNQAIVNTPARIRMTTLYAVAASCGG
ncbi:MAG: NAD(+) synthase, partial [Ruminococcus sp.]|nr:NAD(+) synthase [Ruminococcus sp.]